MSDVTTELEPPYARVSDMFTGEFLFNAPISECGHVVEIPNGALELGRMYNLKWKVVYPPSDTPFWSDDE